MLSTDVWTSLLAGPTGAVLAGIWGALWGSFFNVVVVRVPKGESLVHPPSHCTSCQQPLHWYDNIPIVSYLALRGRCRMCGAHYSARYMLVEVLMAALTVALHRVYVVHGDAEISLRVAQLVITSIFSGLLVAIAFIDLATMRIPNVLTYPGIPVAVALSLLMQHPHLWDGALGAVAGYLLIRLIADGWELMTGRQGMGYGDAKLLALIAGLMGWQALLPTLMLASVQGSLIGITALVIARRSERHQSSSGVEDDQQSEPHSLRTARIPFGPYLSLAAIELLFLRDALPQLFPYFY